MSPAETETDRDPDRRAEPTRCVQAGFVAAVWWKLAPNPDGTYMARGGGWYQGLGSFDLPWETLPSWASGLDRLRVTASRRPNSVHQHPRRRIKENERDELLRELTVLEHSLTAVIV